MKLNFRGIAQLIMVLLSENSQPDGVVFAGDDDGFLTADAVAETVGRRRADDVAARLVDPQRLPHLAGVFVRLDFECLDGAFALFAVNSGLFQHVERQITAGRFAGGVGDVERGVKRFTGNVYVAQCGDADLQPASREQN